MKLYEVYNRLEQIEDLFCRIEERSLTQSQRKWDGQFTIEEVRTIVMLQSMLEDLTKVLKTGDIAKLDFYIDELREVVK